MRWHYFALPDVCQICNNLKGKVCIENGTLFWILSFLGAFAKLRKATVVFVVSVCPSVCMEQIGSQ